MIGQQNREVEKKIAAILKVISDSPQPLGGRMISRRLHDQGINLGERGVRYHLKIMDERGLTTIAGHRDGRSITRQGQDEMKSLLVYDKMGFLTSRIELLAYYTTYNIEENTGNVPIDVSLIPATDYKKALGTLKEIFNGEYYLSLFIAVAEEKEKLGDIVIPQGTVGLATLSNAVINGCLLKAGIPLDSRYCGILHIHNNRPYRFMDLIQYDGSTIDPPIIFISSRFTGVNDAVKHGEGMVMASYHEVPMFSRPGTEETLLELQNKHLCRSFILGQYNEPVCDIPARPNRIGLVTYSGLNPAAALSESGIKVTVKTMCGVMDIWQLKKFRQLSELD
jgi:HTH-type transcriptional regulator, global nitrogen regulator NrpRI